MNKSRLLWLGIGVALFALIAIGILVPLLRQDLEATTPQARSDAETIRKALARDEKVITLPADVDVKFSRVDDGWTAKAMVTDDDLVYLAQHHVVDRVFFKHGDVGKRGLLALSREPITSLRMFRPEIEPGALAEVAGLTGLQILSISGSPTIGDEQMLYLTGPPSLTYLDVRETGVSDKFLAHIVGIYPQLSQINLRKCKNITADGIKHLARLEKLRHLNLNNTRMDRAAVKSLAGFKHLVELELVDTGIGDEEVGLLKNLRLTILELAEDPLTDKSLDVIASMKSLRRVNLRRCKELSEAALARLRHRRSDLSVKTEADPGDRKGEIHDKQVIDLFFDVEKERERKGKTGSK
ncbi:MAG: hypothetical protein KC777_22230 [Cyanobacteria bacterium HKST-UBA02]|nr:hypothetical protein [Cyanobacteria bacterium HKST-UBA02]